MANNTPTRLSFFLIDARTRMGLTQKRFGKLIGASQGYIHQLESGVRTIKNNQKLEALAHKIGVDPDILYFFSGRLPPDIEMMEPDLEQIKVGFDTMREIFRSRR